MYGQFDNHRGQFMNRRDGSLALSEQFADIQENEPLPPIRRINNHLPPRHLRPLGAVRPPDNQWRNPQNVGRRKINMNYSDAGSVMNLSSSMSDSQESYTDEDYSSDDAQTTYTYTEDDSPTVMNCMNSLFLPASNDHDGNDAGIIRCHRVGPTSAALELNITLPSRYLRHLAPVPEGERSTFSDNMCRGPGYNSAHYDPSLNELVVEIDPYKQFRERVAPQFYESLIEEMSDEEADSENYEDEDEYSRQRDDSQIFGELDAYRDAVYNEMFHPMRSPPSQIFVTESQGSAPTEMTQNADEESQGILNAIELSLNGSSDVFSRPEDGHDALLNNHLRESVEAGNNTLVLKVYDTFGFVSEDHPEPRAETTNVDTAPSQDGSATDAVLEARSSATRPDIKSMLSNEQNDSGEKSTNQDPGRLSSPSNAIAAETEKEIVTLEQSSPKTSVKDTSGPMLHTFPSFDDEPGRITVHRSTKLKQSCVPDLVKEDEQQSLAPKPFEHGVGVMPTFHVDDGFTTEDDAPDDEGMGIPAPRFSLGSSMKDQEAPVDENVGRLAVNKGRARRPRPLKYTTPFDLQADFSSNFAKNFVTQSVKEESIDEPLEESKLFVNQKSMVGERSPSSTKYLSQEYMQDQEDVDYPLKKDTVLVKPPGSRLILEVTSKTNVRTEIYQANPSFEKQGKTARELRKDRIRPFDSMPPPPPPPPPPLVEKPLASIMDRANNEASTARNLLKILEDIDDLPALDTIDEQPDLEDLLEFHSCEEEGFTVHARTGFSTGFASSNFY